MASRQIEDENHKKHKSPKVLGPLLLYFLRSVTENMEVCEKR